MTMTRTMKDGDDYDDDGEDDLGGNSWRLWCHMLRLRLAEFTWFSAVVNCVSAAVSCVGR